MSGGSCLKAGQARRVRARASRDGGACAARPAFSTRLRVLWLEAEQLLGLVRRHKEGRVAEGEEALAETRVTRPVTRPPLPSTSTIPTSTSTIPTSTSTTTTSTSTSTSTTSTTSTSTTSTTSTTYLGNLHARLGVVGGHLHVGHPRRRAAQLRQLHVPARRAKAVQRRGRQWRRRRVRRRT